MSSVDATNKATAEVNAAPWYAAFPAPQSPAVTISREEVLDMLKAAPLGKRDFVLVDLRRNDFEVCCLNTTQRPSVPHRGVNNGY